MTESIAFIGLGALGFQMANNLVSAGHSLTVWNRTVEKAAPLVARGARLAGSAADAVTPGGVVLTCLWDGDSVEDVVRSEGFRERLGRGGIHVSMSTIGPEAAKRVAAMHEKAGSIYVEAPVFGRPEAAMAKKLVVPIAGAAAAKAKVRPILEAVGASGIFDFGEVAGAAVAVKLAGNFMIGSAARTMVEAVGMASKNGADAAAMVQMLTTTLFAAPIYQAYGKAILDPAPQTQSPIIMKDINAFIDAAKKVGASTDIAGTVARLFS